MTDLLQAIAEIDAMPNPRREQLSIATLVRVVARGTRAGLAMRAVDPEAAPGELARHVDPLAPVDPTRQDADTWARIGALTGAKDAWAGLPFRLPPDCPRGEARAAYSFAWAGAAGVVMEIRMEVGHHE